METFFTAALMVFLFIVLGVVFIGFYLMSQLVGGFGNLKALYRLFTGKEKSTTRQSSAKSSDKSSRTYHEKTETTGGKAHTDDKVFGQNEGTYVEYEEVKD